MKTLAEVNEQCATAMKTLAEMQGRFIATMETLGKVNEQFEAAMAELDTLHDPKLEKLGLMLAEMQNKLVEMDLYGTYTPNP